MRDNQIMGLEVGGADGGVRLSTGVTTGTYTLIIVETGVTLSVLENEAGTNLLTAKNLGSFAFTAERILTAGIGHTIKKISFTGGEVWGYTSV
jgi:hypothetical protein